MGLQEASKREPKALLRDRPAVMFHPELAGLFGVCGALLLQQVHYWSSTRRNVRDGRSWTYNTLEEWRDQLGAFSVKTLQRTIADLKVRGVLHVGRYNDHKYDRTSWYAIDYQQLVFLLSERLGGTWSLCPEPSGQIVLKVVDAESTPIPEIYPETTAESNQASEAGGKPGGGDSPAFSGKEEVHEETTMKAEDIIKMHQGKKEQKVEKPTASGLPSHWMKRCSLHYEGYQKPLTQADAGKLKHLWKALQGDAYLVLDHVIGNWTEFSWAVKKARGLSMAPTVPDIGFLLKHHDVALQLIAVAPAQHPVAAKADIDTKKSSEAVQSVVKPGYVPVSEQEQAAAMEELQALVAAKKGVL